MPRVTCTWVNRGPRRSERSFWTRNGCCWGMSTSGRKPRASAKTITMPRSAFVFALLALSIGATGFAQQAAQPAVTFKSEVGVVEINAVVTDGAGNFVGDLTKDDFQVYED